MRCSNYGTVSDSFWRLRSLQSLCTTVQLSMLALCILPASEWFALDLYEHIVFQRLRLDIRVEALIGDRTAVRLSLAVFVHSTSCNSSMSKHIDWLARHTRKPRELTCTLMCETLETFMLCGNCEVQSDGTIYSTHAFLFVAFPIVFCKQQILLVSL